MNNRSETPSIAREVRPLRGRRAGHQRRRLRPQFLLLASIALAGLFPLYRSLTARRTTVDTRLLAEAASAIDAPVRSAVLREESRPVYPYSVIRGGAYSALELEHVLDRDQVAAAHYAGFDRTRIHTTHAEAGQSMYASYRVRDSIYWTRNTVRLVANETLLTDGDHLARARCGNRLSLTPQQPIGPDVDLASLDDLDSAAGVADGVDGFSEPMLAFEVFPGMLESPGLQMADRPASTALGTTADRVTNFGFVGGVGLPGGGIWIARPSPISVTQPSSPPSNGVPPSSVSGNTMPVPVGIGLVNGPTGNPIVAVLPLPTDPGHITLPPPPGSNSWFPVPPGWSFVPGLPPVSPSGWSPPLSGPPGGPLIPPSGAPPSVPLPPKVTGSDRQHDVETNAPDPPTAVLFACGALLVAISYCLRKPTRNQLRP